MEFIDYDFKFSKTILHDLEMSKEIEHIIKTTNLKLGRKIRPTPSKILQKAFLDSGWKKEKIVIEGQFLRFDLYKNKIAIEIELTDPSDCYNAYLKFLLGYNHGIMEVGVIIVYDNSIEGDNLPKLCKVINDLEIYRRVIPCPIWVIGLKQ
ncbi:MAG: BglII/BstYI family type II restriction endonuclease [bacterium]